MRTLIAMRDILWNGRMYQAGEPLPTNTPIAEVWVENKVAQWADALEQETASMNQDMEGTCQPNEVLEKADTPSEVQPEGDLPSGLASDKAVRESKRVGRNKLRSPT